MWHEMFMSRMVVVEVATITLVKGVEGGGATKTMVVTGEGGDGDIGDDGRETP